MTSACYWRPFPQVAVAERSRSGHGFGSFLDRVAQTGPVCCRATTARRGSSELGGRFCQQADRNSTDMVLPALGLLAAISRARGPRRPSDVGQQSDPQTERPAPAAWAAVGRRRMMMLLLRPPAARCELRGIAKPAALNDQAFSAALVSLAPNPRARGARRHERRRSTERPAIRPTRSSRLGGASPISFSRYSPWGRNDGARAFGANAGGGRRRRPRAGRYGVMENRRH